MKKTLIFSGLTLVAVLASASAMAHSVQIPHPSKATSTQKFNGLEADGHVNIILRPAKHHSASYVINNSDPGNNWIIANISNNTLYVKEGGTNPQAKESVIVYVNRLNHLTTYGHSKVTANHLISKDLSVTANNHSKIHLNGMIALSHLYVNDYSRVNIKWLKSNTLTVFQNGNSRIKLAGLAQQLRAKIVGNSFFNAEYLRSNNAWLQTRNYAQAKVLSSASLQAYANDKSNIYYYKTPKLTNQINKQSGNTLQLGWQQ